MLPVSFGEFAHGLLDALLVGECEVLQVSGNWESHQPARKHLPIHPNQYYQVYIRDYALLARTKEGALPPRHGVPLDPIPCRPIARRGKFSDLI